MPVRTLPEATPLPPKPAMVGPMLDPTAEPAAAKPVPEIDLTPPDKAGDVPATPPNLGIESLREAIVVALRENPDIQIALARQDDARYGVHQANAGYLPKLDLTLGVGPDFNRPATGSWTGLRRSEATASLNQTVWDFGVTINDIKRARADYRSAQWATRERIEAIAYDITSAYLNVLQSQKLVDLSQQEIAAHLKLLKMVTIQNELGLNTAADVSRAKSRLENIRSVQLDRESLLQQAREGYRRLTKRLPARAVDIPSAEPALPPSQDAAVDLIDKRSPRMAQAMEDRRSWQV
jgi:outer membrane protein TolC